MKKKLANSSISCWIMLLLVLNLLHTTHGAVSYNTKSLHHLPYSLKNQRSLNEMKLHIMNVLNFQSDNSTAIDTFITAMFNLKVNPSYVFRLPDSKYNRTIVYKKTDFLDAVFPNVTNINKFNKTSDNLQTSASQVHNYKAKEDLNNELQHEKHFFDSSRLYHEDLDENLIKVIEENVRTERNFIMFMDDLNQDLDDEDKRIIQKKKNASKPKSEAHKSQKQRDEESYEWDLLGLSGWSGAVKDPVEQTSIESPPKHNHPVTARPPTKKHKLPSGLSQLQASFDPLSYLKPPPNQQSKSKNRHKQIYKKIPDNVRSVESHEHSIDNIANQLTELLDEEQAFFNKTGKKDQRIKWPITSSREMHLDKDVYIARANNPFGHSTKWKSSNTSEIGEKLHEGRSKRGALHLYSMIKCATGCDPIIFKGYGCYCGFLGSGRALDGIDRCCKMHDYCYTVSGCPMFLEYFVPYLWKCYRGQALCALDHGEWGGPHSCASRLCKCDLALSKCMRRYHCPKKRPVCTSSPFRLLQNLVMVF